MDEVDDSPMFGEEGPQPIEEGNGGGMDRIKPEESRFFNGKRREVTPEVTKDFPDLLVSPRAMADETVGDEFLDVGAAQRDSDRIAVFDLVEGILIDLSGLLDPLLKGCNDPEGKGGSLLSQVLEKADVFMVGVGYRAWIGETRKAHRPEERGQKSQGLSWCAGSS